MKRFIMISMMACTAVMSGWACGPEGPRYNNYLFSIFPREQMGNIFKERVDQFWKEYTGNTSEYYYWYISDAMEAAEGKNDQEMKAYLELLGQYLDISGSMTERWNYPTKEEKAEQKVTMKKIKEKAIAYRGERLKAQYALLIMRVNMLQAEYAANKTYWEQTASQLPASVYRDMMENIYANALLHTQQRIEACDIYARQGDMRSIKWCMRKFRNVAGIETTYKATPSSPTLRFLVQDFVNSTQETKDNMDYVEWLKEIDMNPVYRQDIDQFLRLASRVVAEGKTTEPSFWQAAAGCLHFFLGDDQLAYDELSKAMKMQGTQRMHDNARAIRMLVAARLMKVDKKFNKFMLGEMEWLDQKITEERGSRDFFENHYTDVKDRLVFQVLAPKYNAAGNFCVAMALRGMIQEEPVEYSSYHPRSPRNQSQDDEWNQDYGTEYFYYVDSLSADELKEYAAWLREDHKDAFEQYVVSSVYRDVNYFNDLVGTKYLAEGRFVEAIPFLEKVPISFLQKQNIAIYMLNRNFSAPRWTVEQKKLSDYEEFNRKALKENPKLNFCNEMIQLQAQYNLAGAAATRQKVAYKMATNYYQASYLGDCWFLTHYGKSCTDTVHIGDKDFVQAAIDLLQESKLSQDSRIKQASLYALAFIPRDSWCEIEYRWDSDLGEYDYIFTPLPQARQYQAIKELALFVRENPNNLMPEISRCDVLKTFRKMNHI